MWGRVEVTLSQHIDTPQSTDDLRVRVRNGNYDIGPINPDAVRLTFCRDLSTLSKGMYPGVSQATLTLVLNKVWDLGRGDFLHVLDCHDAVMAVVLAVQAETKTPVAPQVDAGPVDPLSLMPDGPT